MTEEDFIKKDYFISDYVLVGTDIEEIKEKTETLTAQQKDAWKEVYAFAHGANRAGRKWTSTDVKHLCEQFYISKEKVEKVFQKIEKENKDEFGINDKPDIYKVEVWLKKQWDFAENDITQVAEFKKKEDEKYELLNADTIFRKLQHANFKFSMAPTVISSGKPSSILPTSDSSTFPSKIILLTSASAAIVVPSLKVLLSIT